MSKNIYMEVNNCAAYIVGSYLRYKMKKNIDASEINGNTSNRKSYLWL